MSKQILCLDFDGVLHSYESGWKGADVIPDPPVPGARDFLIAALEHFVVAVYSSRSNQDGGVEAMQKWCHEHFGFGVSSLLAFPKEKPAAKVTLDDRALTFTGKWPSIGTLIDFEPWNKS